MEDTFDIYSQLYEDWKYEGMDGNRKQKQQDWNNTIPSPEA